MRLIITSTVVMLLASAASAQDGLKEIDKPASKLDQILAHQLDEGGQEVRVVRATIDPRTTAAWHTHPTPVYLYIMDGELTMEVEGKEARTVSAGEALAEPLNAKMRVINKGDEPVEVVVFQISPPDKKFLEQNKQ